MPGFLKFLGLFNAAVWVGGSLFFTFLAGPAFFSPEVKSISPPPANGIIAQMMLGRYFTLHLLCGIMAIVHLLVEWLYSGGGFPRRSIAFVGVLLILALFSGKFIGPRLTIWHQQKHQFQINTQEDGMQIESKTYTKEVQKTAKRQFSIWHGVSQTLNLIMLFMLVWRFWILARSYSPSPKTNAISSPFREQSTPR
ncbi:MAG: DUF4149 domain-containing protein [Verrucomicrobiota bacterium]|nr:DUF4149 domain-containing protein [Verrucomicrobiota bacterium]